jgi:hypothetical protein
MAKKKRKALALGSCVVRRANDGGGDRNGKIVGKHDARNTWDVQFSDNGAIEKLRSNQLLRPKDQPAEEEKQEDLGEASQVIEPSSSSAEEEKEVEEEAFGEAGQLVEPSSSSSLRETERPRCIAEKALREETERQASQKKAADRARCRERPRDLQPGVAEQEERNVENAERMSSQREVGVLGGAMLSYRVPSHVEMTNTNLESGDQSTLASPGLQLHQPTPRSRGANDDNFASSPLEGGDDGDHDDDDQPTPTPQGADDISSSHGDDDDDDDVDEGSGKGRVAAEAQVQSNTYVKYTQPGAVDVHRTGEVFLVKYGCMVFAVEGSCDLARELDTQLHRLFALPKGLLFECAVCHQKTQSFPTFVWHQQTRCKLGMDTPIQKMWNPSFPMFFLVSNRVIDIMKTTPQVGGIPQDLLEPGQLPLPVGPSATQRGDRVTAELRKERVLLKAKRDESKNIIAMVQKKRRYLEKNPRSEFFREILPEMLFMPFLKHSDNWPDSMILLLQEVT